MWKKFIVGFAMIKEFDGIPPMFKGMCWSSDLSKVGISLQVLVQPVTKWMGLNYKRDGKSKSIVWNKEAGLNEMESLKIIRKFEIKHFDIPDSISKYAEAING